MSDLFERVLAAIRARADVLDSGVLAPPEVGAMSDAEYETAWAEVLADHFKVIEHRPVQHGDTCVEDGQQYPCPTIQQLLARYRVDTR